MKNYQLYFILAILSLLFASYNVFVIFSDNTLNEINIALKTCMIIALIGSTALFFSAFVEKHWEKNNTLPAIYSKSILVALLIITVTCLSAIHYEIANQGFKLSYQLYWQIFSILLSVGIILFLIKMMKRLKTQ